MVAVMEIETLKSTTPEKLPCGLAERMTATVTGPIAGRSNGDLVTALLLIDDADRLGEVAGFLVRSGLLVETVSDPHLAGGLAPPGHRYAVILLDVLLPVRELYRLCRRLRSSGRVPMVIASWEDRSGLDAGPGDRVVPHSISAADLADRVMAVLSVHPGEELVTD